MKLWANSVRWLWAAAIVVLLLAPDGTAILAEEAPALVSTNASPADSFYRRPASISSTPGVLLRREPLADRVLPEGAQAWRIQYTSTAPDGSPTIAVVTVLAPEVLPGRPLPVVAWDHGAVGLVQRCLPSATADPWTGMPALAEVVAHGWIVVATDYQTDKNGIHPFLIGEGEARSTLDALRALRQMHELSVDNRTVVWGHSQGGHAALWASMIATTYAPDVTIDGVVAIAPATSLGSLLNRQHESGVAPILGSWVAAAYSAYYPDVVYDAVVSSAALVLGRELASRCPPEPLDGLAIALILRELKNRPLLNVPAPESFRIRLEENEPDGDFTAPVVVVQGLDDVVILPDVTAEFVAKRCAAGATISYWTLPGQDHLSLVQPGSPLEGALITWTAQRFAGEPLVEGCTGFAVAGEQQSVNQCGNDVCTLAEAGSA